MLIPLKWAEVHTPLFLKGTNLGAKLDVEKRTGLMLWYERKEKELVVLWQGEWAMIPLSNVASMVPKNQAEAKDLLSEWVNVPAEAPAQVETPVPEAPTEVKRGPGRPPKVQAQVSTPTGHVFEGPGAGKS